MATEGNKLGDALGCVEMREKGDALYREGKIEEGESVRSRWLEYATRLSNSCQSLYSRVNSGSSGSKTTFKSIGYVF